VAELDVGVDLALGGFRLSVAWRTGARSVALVGPSGSGKSTLLRILAGVERRAHGHVRFDGATWQGEGAWTPPHDRHVGWVPQDASLFPHLSVRRNLAYAGATASDVSAMADRLGIAALLDRRPRNLSGGERQRVALGRALLSRPRLLLLDEPFAALDTPLRARLSADVAALTLERSLPVIVVTHHAADVEALADERWVLADGTLRRHTLVTGS
jgi:molybdate transport system ATP-binding protein